MAEKPPLAKAQLIELDAKLENEASPSYKVTVQFNPESLKVSLANQIAQPQGGAGNQQDAQAQQFVGAGTMKLAVQLWFDVNAPQHEGEARADDVRKLTAQVAYFITPKKEESRDHFIPPGVRFLWGSFQFDGLMDTFEESLEFFSPEGRPLRASVSFTLSRQKIVKFEFGKVNSPGSKSPAAGTRAMTAAPGGSTMQGMAASAGQGGNWQAIASANGVENPRLLQPGQLLDLKAGVKP